MLSYLPIVFGAVSTVLLLILVFRSRPYWPARFPASSKV